MVTFSFADSVTFFVPTFHTCEANFSKPITDTDTMFPLKVAQDPGLRFRRKKISEKKLGFMVFLKEVLKKTLFLTVFYV